MEMVLLDWTRMGKLYCLAGVVQQNGQLCVVRPLPAAQRAAPVRNIGWSPYLMDGHSRWEIFKLIDPQPAEPSPPHLEDVWVRGMKSRRSLADPAVRRAILQATRTRLGEHWFGAPLTTTRSVAYVSPRTGERSLASLVVPAGAIHFSVSWRNGTAEPDTRVSLAVPELAGRSLPVKDHFLLRRAELASSALEGRIQALSLAVAQMGAEVVVRLGLSRSFQATPSRAESSCWLMADGFFSFNDPQC
ncbi:MAG TPA: hypothetical protein VMG10_17520 [Gemmataceae bacterium]|nr:hypothetical protein [Gemmataceae bacterium]